MAAKEIVPGFYAVPLRIVNAFLFETDDGLILIDMGLPGSEGRIPEVVADQARKPAARTANDADIPGGNS